MFEKADKILEKLINQKGFGKAALSAQICLEADGQLRKIFPKFRNKITVESFDKGILKLSLKSAIVNQEIQFKKDLLIKKINQKLGSDLVKDLRFGIR